MGDFLDKLAKTAEKNFKSGYYKDLSSISRVKASLKQKILSEKIAAVISEIKSASPSAGIIRKSIDPNKIAKSMEKGGAIGLSVLTEPTYFNGSLTTLKKARGSVKLPILMKDIILFPSQIVAANKVGANAVLFIQALFDRGYCDHKLEEMIDLAHSKELEVLLETHNQKEFKSAIETTADLVGINNRDLGSLKINLNTTKKILENESNKNKIVISESGINTAADLSFLHSFGVDAFLIGSAIMKSRDIQEKVREFVLAIERN